MPGVQPGIELQERDLALLEDLFVSRLMTLAHVAALHFSGRSEAAKKRLQKLKSAGFVSELPRRARDPGVLHLSQRGYTLLRDRGRLMSYPRLSAPAVQKRARVSELTLRHELDVMDVKAALLPAINQSPGFTVLEFTTWPLLHQFDVYQKGRGEFRVKPDGFIRVREDVSRDEAYKHAFFLEVDRGTETLDTLTEKAVAYREHYARGGFAESVGAQRTDFTEHPFRVLFVLPTEERRNNMAERLLELNPPIETHAWLTNKSALVESPLGDIWLRPHDYRAAPPSRPLQIRGLTPHRRSAARDGHIRAHVRLSMLFSD